MKKRYYIVYLRYGKEVHDELTTFGVLMFLLLSTIYKKIELINIALQSYDDNYLGFDVRDLKS